LSLRADGVFATARNNSDCVRVALLRHEHAGAGVRTGEIDEVELLTRPDLQILGQLALARDQAGSRREQADQSVELPHRIPGVLDHSGKAEQSRDVIPVSEQAAAIHAARSSR
jgi:hypothetical protein